MALTCSTARRAAAAAAAVALSLPLVVGCTSDGAVESGDNQGFVSADLGVDVIPADEREAAPDVTGTTLDGDEISLADYAGDVVVMNVWGSWCAPCRAEAPALQETYKSTKGDGVQFLGINVRDQEASARAFEDTFEITYPSFVDPSSRILLEFRDTVPASGIPSTVVIDRDGRVAARVVGPTTYSQLSKLVDDVASEK
jgi:peroxiredoxin